MLLSFAIIVLGGMAAAAIFQKLRLPGIIGMLLMGVLIGPFVLNLVDGSVLDISAQLRQMALIIILLKAGLSLDLADLKKVGRPAVLMSFVPACAEVAGYVLLAPLLLHISRTEAALMGAVLSAVSPAVVVPRMVALIEEKRGTQKSIPQMILAGASCDDVFVIVLFSSFLTMAQGDAFRVQELAAIPVSIVLGVALGAVVGMGITLFFRRVKLRHSKKVIVLLAISFLLMAAEEALKPVVAVSGLLAVMTAACVLKLKSPPSTPEALSARFSKLWIAAEVLLFVLVGAAVDIRYTLEAGLPAAAMIFTALVFRSAGVLLCTAGTDLRPKERLFCVIAYLPKATVQAAIGSVPLTMGLPCGRLVLSVAVLAIIITAPLGAFGIDQCSRSWLHDDSISH